ncbi:hypothetical protein HDE_06683 [Halotydeus destructor]|nr:hypothetical protein HDE_06683 [Halotydeus destructor]
MAETPEMSQILSPTAFIANEALSNVVNQIADAELDNAECQSVADNTRDTDDDDYLSVFDMQYGDADKSISSPYVDLLSQIVHCNDDYAFNETENELNANQDANRETNTNESNEVARVLEESVIEVTEHNQAIEIIELDEVDVSPENIPNAVNSQTVPLSDDEIQQQPAQDPVLILQLDCQPLTINHLDQLARSSGWNYQDEDGKTILHSLVLRNKVGIEEHTFDLVTHALDSGADAGLEDNDGDNVLHLAIKFDCEPVFRAIIFHDHWGANESYMTSGNSRGFAPLHLCIMSQVFCKTDYLDDFIKQSSVNLVNSDGNTPLHLLFTPGTCFKKTVQYCDIIGSPVVQRSRKDLPAAEERLFVMKLIRSGADIKLRNNYGNLAFDCALRRNSHEDTLLALFPSAVTEDEAKSYSEKLVKLDPLPFRALKRMLLKMAAYGIGVNHLDEEATRVFRHIPTERFFRPKTFCNLRALMYNRKYSQLLNHLLASDDKMAKRIGNEIPYMLTFVSSQPTRFIYELTQVLLQKKFYIDVNRIDEKTGHVMFNLIKSASSQAEKAISCVLKVKNLDLEVRHSTIYGKTSALQYAINKGEWDIAMKLVNHGAAVKDLKVTSLFKGDFLDCFKLLHVHGKTLNVSQISWMDRTKYNIELKLYDDFINKDKRACLVEVDKRRLLRNPLPTTVVSEYVDSDSDDDVQIIS